MVQGRYSALFWHPNHIIKEKKDAMKHKKDLKHKLAEVIYRKPSLGKKVAAIEKSMKEVNKLINDTK